MKKRHFVLWAGLAAVLTLAFATPAYAAAVPGPQPTGQPGGSMTASSQVQQIADDRRFRSDFGFRSDEAYVRSLYAALDAGQSAGITRQWGALLTSAEVQDMTRRQAIADAVAAPATRNGVADSPNPFSAYLQRYPDSFAGSYLDQQSDGAVTVMFTTDAALHERALRGIFPYGDHLHVVQARFTLADLTSWSREVVQAIPALRAEGVNALTAGPDIRSNTVVVGVASATVPAAQRALMRLLPGRAISVIATEPFSPLGEHEVDAPPVRGGQWITSTTSAPATYEIECTSAFVVKDNTNAAYALTAGHCANVGDVWNQGDSFCCFAFPIGTTKSSEFAGGTQNDAAIISIASGQYTNQVFVTQQSCGFLCSNSTYRNVTASERSATVGEATCLAGSTSGGEHCTTISAIDQCVTYSGTETVCYQAFAGYAAQPGDSGGSWYQLTGGSNVTAQGVESGGNGTQSNFTEINVGLNFLCSSCYVYT